MSVVVGSRVEYTGPSRPDWLGIPATVTHIRHDYASVRFDREWNDRGVTGIEGYGIPLANLEEIKIMIDPKRPVQGSNGVKFRTIGVLERVKGTVTLLLETPAGNEFEIGLDGTIVKANNTVWTVGYTFSNEPKVDSGFHPLRAGRQGPYGRGMSDLSFAKSDYPEAEAYIEIVYTDGKATGVKFHAR